MTTVATFPDAILKQLRGDDYETEHRQYVPKLLFFDFSDETAYSGKVVFHPPVIAQKETNLQVPKQEGTMV